MKSINHETFAKILVETLTENNKSLELNIREIGYDTSVTLGVNEETIQNENNIARDKLLYLYFYIFYEKTPDDFSTEDYKRESERFNKVLETSPNSKFIKSQIEDILEGKKIDSYEFITNPETKKIFDVLIFNSLLKPLQHESITFHNILIPQRFIADTRIYLNPNGAHYGDLVTFLQKEAALQELNLGFKTRIDTTGGADKDTLILYTTSKDVAKVVEILDKYKELNPDKVATFGSTIVSLATMEGEEWYGISLNPQGVQNNIASSETYNSFVDINFEKYIFPVIFIEKLFIATAHNPSDREKIFIELFNSLNNFNQKFKNSLPLELQENYPLVIAKAVAAALSDPKIAKKFIEDLIDISDIVDISDSYSEKYRNFSEKERRGLSPEHYRKPMERDIALMGEQMIPLTLKNGVTINISRHQLSNILKSQTFVNDIKRYYKKNPSQIKEDVVKIGKLWNHIHHNLYKFADKKHTNLTVEAAENLNNYENKKKKKKTTKK